MSDKKTSIWTAAAALAVLLAAPLAAPLYGAGFALYEHGAKAMGLAGAFTAQADDPSALFHNVGGLAFFEEREVAAGFTLVTSHDESFVGLGPGPAEGTTGTLESLAEPLPHLYWIEPLGRSWRFGLAINSTFGLKTDWEDPDRFAGRYINTEASLFVADLNPNLGVQLTDNLGIGFGAILRFSEVELNRRIPSFDPLSLSIVDVAAARLASDLDTGLGFQVGILHRASPNFSWGLAYRSRLTVDYGGTARFTQILTGNPALDQLIGATLPFDRDLPVETEIEFPDTATLGLAFSPTPSTLVELDLNWAGWSSFETLRITFPTFPPLDFLRAENWEDVYNYRLGVLLGRGGVTELRFGVVWDESPQPTEAVSPLLPDADRVGYTFGWGRRGDRLAVDLSVMYLDFDPRTNDRSIDGFNGTYSQTGWLLAATFGF